MMMTTLIPLLLLLLLPLSISSQVSFNRGDNNPFGHDHGHSRTTTNAVSPVTPVKTTTNDIEGLLGNTTEPAVNGNSTDHVTQASHYHLFLINFAFEDPDIDKMPVIISNPWVRTQRLQQGFGNLTWTSKSVVPRLFSDMGRAGFPPLSTIMHWPCWNGVDETAKEEFREIFNENNTKGEVKSGLDEWIIKYNGTAIADKIRFERDDFEDRMRLFTINFESALSTLSTAVRTFNDVAMDDSMTIAESNIILNNIADILDRNFVKSMYYLFNGNVMNGKKLQKIIASAVTTTVKPARRTFPPMSGNNTGNGVWHGNWKRYTVIRRVTRSPNTSTPL